MKDQKLTIRLSAHEKEALMLHAAAAGKTISKYLLDAALADEKELEDENRSIVFQLRRLGTNLNQAVVLLRNSRADPSVIKTVLSICKELQEWRIDTQKMATEYWQTLHRYYKDFLKMKSLEIKNKQLELQIKQTKERRRLR